jgi:peroxiredoxin
MHQISLSLLFSLLSALLLFSSCGGEKPTTVANEAAATTTAPATNNEADKPKEEEQLTGYKVGDVAADFSLKNVDNSMVSLANIKDAKGFIVVFTCNHCPYAIAYEDRLIALQKQFKPLGYLVVAINPNDPAVVAEDSFEEMQKRAKDKKFNFAYLFDEGQKVYPVFGATRTPHCYVLEKNAENQLIVKYIGAIDDNHENPAEVKATYLADAVNALIAGKQPTPDFTKAIGCSIKKS